MAKLEHLEGGEEALVNINGKVLEMALLLLVQLAGLEKH